MGSMGKNKHFCVWCRGYPSLNSMVKIETPPDMAWARNGYTHVCRNKCFRELCMHGLRKGYFIKVIG